MLNLYKEFCNPWPPWLRTDGKISRIFFLNHRQPNIILLVIARNCFKCYASKRTEMSLAWLMSVFCYSNVSVFLETVSSHLGSLYLRGFCFHNFFFFNILGTIVNYASQTISRHFVFSPFHTNSVIRCNHAVWMGMETSDIWEIILRVNQVILK